MTEYFNGRIIPAQRYGALSNPRKLQKLDKDMSKGEESREMAAVNKLYQLKEEADRTEVGQSMREIERILLLRVCRSRSGWTHIDAMDQLRQGIGLRAYGQRDPGRSSISKRRLTICSKK